MYERSAIVLERYFENLFGFNKPSNLLQNYKNYCELFEKFINFQNANNEEFRALEEFQAAETAIEEIQAQEEKLYKKNAKYEYNRDLIFNDITQKPEEIQKCMEKIESDIAKTQNSLISLRESFVESVINYNEKKSTLSKCKKNRRSAEAEYNAVFDVTKQNIENIPEEYITTAKAFSMEENQEDLIDVMLENGKDEKIPFNNAVVRNAVKVSFDIQKRIIDSYIEIYNKTNKLIEELLEGAVSVEVHEKTIRNIDVKLNFLAAEKDYLVQFLDYERIMVIHGKRMHRNLMLEACENFDTDIAQIDNLYALLIREITNKSTKKAYKELYNKSYLIEIEENDERFKKEKTKINLSTATIMNTNYWRIEGIKNIYTVFYKDVVEVFGKMVDEFEVPKDPDDEDVENVVTEEAEIMEQEPVQEEAIVVEEVKEKKKAKTVIIETVSEDAPALPGMEEAVEENESAEVLAKEKAKAERAAKKAKEVAESLAAIEIEEEKAPEPEVIEVVKETKAKAVAAKAKATKEEKEVVEKVSEPAYIDVFDEIEVEPEPVKETTAKKKKAKAVKRYTRKKNEKVKVAAAVKEESAPAEPISIDDLFDEIETEPDIFGDKYKNLENIEQQIADLDDLDDVNVKTITEEDDNVLANELEEDLPYEEEEVPYEDESIFASMENEAYEKLNFETLEKEAKKSKKKNTKTAKATKTKTAKAEKKEPKEKKSGILKNIMKLNSKDKKKVAAN